MGCTIVMKNGKEYQLKGSAHEVALVVEGGRESQDLVKLRMDSIASRSMYVDAYQVSEIYPDPHS